ncbi:MAG: hypothetical protein ATN32_04055 [Candidatus Epulonipiscium fishelsonii]|nr:MAG: hypothetical protein ATN32_04055 [Epulopiscium sp. AS2M-Bin002]
MKLRQKLAMVLAAAMITTSTPMMTLANSTRIDKTLVLKDEMEVGLESNLKQYLTFEVDIKISAEDSMEVYLEGDNIEFEQNLFNEWAREEGSTVSGDITEFTMGNYHEGTVADNAKGTIKVRRTDDNKLKLTLTGSDTEYIDQFRLPLIYKVTDTGMAKLKIQSGDGRIKETTITLSKGEVGDKDLVAEILDTDVISTEGRGKLGKIKIKEIIEKTLSGKVIKITLNSSAVIFKEEQTGLSDDNPNDEEFIVDGYLGLSSVTPDKVKFVRSDEDHTVGYLIFDKDLGNNAPGEVTIEGLNVEDADGDVSTGEVDVTIELMDFAAMDAFELDKDGDFVNTKLPSGLNTDAEKFNYFIENESAFEKFEDGYDLVWDDIDTADVSDDMEEVEDVGAKIEEDTLIISVEEDAKTIGGKWDEDSNEVKIKITDPTREFLKDNGKVELTLEGAIFAPMTHELKKDEIKEFADEDEFFTEIEIDEIKTIIKIDERNPNVAEIELDGLDENDSELELAFYVIGNLGFDGDIKLTADVNKWDEPISAVVGQVTKPVDINVIQAITVFENEKAQADGMVIISETDEKMFEVNDVIVIKLEDLDIEDATVLADKGMEVDSKVSDGHLLIQVQRKSTAPAIIKISDIKIEGTGYIPLGEYNAYIGGQGIHKANTFINFDASKSSKLVGRPDVADDWEDDEDDYFNNELNLEDYTEDKEEIFAAAFSLESFITSTRPVKPDVAPPIPAPTPEPEPEPEPQPDDVAGEDGNYGLVDAYIEIYDGKAALNGVEVDVNTAPRNINGTTMVGVADLATILGIPRDKEYGNTLTYHQEADGTGVVTIRLENRRTIEIKTGSNKLALADFNSLTNTYKSIGELVAAQPAQVINGRMFVPMRQIGEALGFNVSWDSATQTAIFNNM